MKILAISGSARRASTNTALPRALSTIAPDRIAIDVFDGIGDLPIFSPDREGSHLPDSVGAFARLVSGEQVVGKPIALVHASHRGDDMLASLRIVLSTISTNFNRDLLFRLPVMKETPE